MHSQKYISFYLQMQNRGVTFKRFVDVLVRQPSRDKERSVLNIGTASGESFVCTFAFPFRTPQLHVVTATSTDLVSLCQTMSLDMATVQFK